MDKSKLFDRGFLLKLAYSLIDVLEENEYLRSRNMALEEEVSKHAEFVQSIIDTPSPTSILVEHILNGDITINKKDGTDK